MNNDILKTNRLWKIDKLIIHIEFNFKRLGISL